MPRTLGTMLTYTTYGKWLRGDARRWVAKGAVMAPDLALEAADRGRLRYPPFAFPGAQRPKAGACIGRAILEMGGQVHALHVGRWHMHFVIGYMQVPLSEIVKATKEAVRVGLGYRRAIWAAGYDKRFCFDARSLANRIEYVRKHNLEDGLPLDPWDFIVLPSFLSER